MTLEALVILERILRVKVLPEKWTSSSLEGEWMVFMGVELHFLVCKVPCPLTHY